MRLEAGQLVRLNRDIGKYKNGEIFNVIEIFEDLAVLENILTKDKHFAYKYSISVELVGKEIFHV